MKNIFWKLLIFHIWVCSSSVVDFYVLCEVVVQFSFFQIDSCWTTVVEWIVSLFPTDVPHCSHHPFPWPQGLVSGLWSLPSACLFPLCQHVIWFTLALWWFCSIWWDRLPSLFFFFFCFPSLMYLSPFCSSSDSLFRIVAGIALSLKNNVMRSGMCLIKFISRYFKSVGC